MNKDYITPYEMGHQAGYIIGHAEGYETGRREGFDKGHEKGYQEGFKAGEKEILDKLFPDEFRKEFVKFIKEEIRGDKDNG